MTEGIIKIGDRIEMSIAGIKKDSAVYKVYVSQLLDLSEGSKADIAMPIENGHIVPLGIGMRYDLCFFTSTGLFQCKAIIIDRYKLDNVYILSVQFLSELEKYQRRQFYRLSCAIDFRYHIITEEEKRLYGKIESQGFKNLREKEEILEQIKSIESNVRTGTINNLSGGGIKFGSPEMIELETFLILFFILDNMNEKTPMRLKGKVVSSERTINEHLVYENRIAFVEIPNYEREFIVRYIFNEERKQRRREKGLD